MLDRLAALMLLATAVLGSAALIYALRGDDRLGKHFTRCSSSSCSVSTAPS